MATVIGTNGNDVLFGTGGDDQIFGLGGNDRIEGGDGANTLFGGAGDDELHNSPTSGGNFISVLEGGAGADRILGSLAAAEYASYASSSAGVTVNLGTGSASGGDAQGDVLSKIDGLIGSAFNDVLTGSFNNYTELRGGAGDDVLTATSGQMQGGTGADTLIGNFAALVIYSDSSSGVTVNLATGTGSGGDAEGDVLQYVDRVLGSQHDDVLIGGSQSNNLSGGDGDDVLSGGAVADDLHGGAGEDTVDYSRAGAAVAADLVAGVGTIGEAFGDRFQLIEDLRGSGFNDSLAGDAGANVMEGGAGADTLDGRAGLDTASYAHSAAGVTVSLTTGVASGGDAQGDVLTGFENLRGTAFADTLAGDGGSNTLEGGAGADALYGSAGSDTASYAHSAAAVQVDLVAGTTTGGDAAGDSFFSIENLIGSDHNDVLRGGSGSTLSGGAGDDTLEGSAGADVFDGGAGFDKVLYTASSAGVAVDLQLGTGLAGDALDDVLISIEGLTGSNLADTLTGSDAGNIFYGMAGTDILSGAAGADTLSGGAGADQLDGGSGIDTASYYTGSAGVAVDLAAGTASGGDAAGDALAGIENLTGSNQGDDILVGNGGANVLQGWAGSDVLTGAGGKDALTGGAGADRFVYLDPADSAVGAGADRIADLSHAQGDRIDLSAIDADTGAAGNQAFSFIGSALYSGVAGQLRYAVAAGVTTVAGDVNGDGVSDFHIQLTGAIGLVAGDFVL